MTFREKIEREMKSVNIAEAEGIAIQPTQVLRALHAMLKLVDGLKKIYDDELSESSEDAFAALNESERFWDGSVR